MQIVFQDPYASLNPRMTVGEIVGEGPLVHGLTNKQEREDVVRELLAQGRPQPEPHPPLPARVLGRPAPAHRHRPGARPEPRVHRLRRAGLRARRVDPEPGPEPARRPPAGARADLPVHRPQPRGRRAHQRPRRGHVPGQDRRARQASTSCTAHPRHPYTVALLSAVPETGPAQAQEAPRAQGRRARRPRRRRPAVASTRAAGCASGSATRNAARPRSRCFATSDRHQAVACHFAEEITPETIEAVGRTAAPVSAAETAAG